MTFQALIPPTLLSVPQRDEMTITDRYVRATACLHQDQSPPRRQLPALLVLEKANHIFMHTIPYVQILQSKELLVRGGERYHDHHCNEKDPREAED